MVAQVWIGRCMTEVGGMSLGQGNVWLQPVAQVQIYWCTAKLGGAVWITKAQIQIWAACDQIRQCWARLGWQGPDEDMTPDQLVLGSLYCSNVSLFHKANISNISPSRILAFTALSLHPHKDSLSSRTLLPWTDKEPGRVRPLQESRGGTSESHG